MLKKKLFRTIGAYKAQFISMIIMITLGVGMFVGFNMEWVSIQYNMNDFFEKTGYADYFLVSEQGFSAKEAGEIGQIEGVRAISRFLSVNADVKEQSGDTVALSVSENAEVSGFMLMSGTPYDANDQKGIWLSDRYAKENGIEIGDTLTFLYGGMTLDGQVRGLIKSGEQMICVRDSTQLMPDFSTHGFAYISPAFYARATGLDYYPQLHVLSNLEKEAFGEKADAVLGRTTLLMEKSETPSYSAAEGEADEGKTMGAILPTLFLLIGVLTMTTTMHRLTAKEKVQIGTLKALGFSDRRILRHYTAYAFMVGILGIGFGVGLGYAVAYLIMNPNGMMGTYLDLPRWRLCFPWFCYLVLLGILSLLTLIGYLSVRKMLQGTAADALRPYTPPKMRPLLIEKSRIFHKLSFGVRWNLRDIARQKSRTAMSLLGIIGCTILVVGSMGMRDTMNAFLKMYYEEGQNYASRIYLSADANEAQRTAVWEKYKGDRSATVSVKAKEKTVSLDIYDLARNHVRIAGKDGNPIRPLSDEGAYLCLRLSEEFGLSEGDTFEISSYGSDQIYTLRVAGVYRSVSESIAVSASYAESLNLPFAFDSVYTDTPKEEIVADAAIKTVQSKQMIMDSFETFTDLMDTMIYLLVFGALLLGVIVLYNLGVMSYTERYREMATLKVVGFPDRKIGRLLVEQNLWLSVLGVLCGIPLGAAVLSVLLKALAGEYEMKMKLTFGTCLIATLLTVAMSLSVSFFISRKNRKIDMVEALKGVD